MAPLSAERVLAWRVVWPEWACRNGPFGAGNNWSQETVKQGFGIKHPMVLVSGVRQEG